VTTIPPSRRRWWTFPAIATCYFVAAKLGLMLAFIHASATTVWPPTGIALASLLLFGQGIWPALFVGAFLANLTTAGNLWTSLAIAIGNTLEGSLGAYLVTRFAKGRLAFERARDIFRFGVVAGILSTTVSATIGVTSLALGGFLEWDHYGAVWLTWWLGDAAGALIVAPVVILWSGGVSSMDRRRVGEPLLLLGALIAISMTVSDGLLAPWVRNQPLEFLCVPVLVWAALRYRQQGVATGLAFISAIAAWGTLHGRGPFVGATPNESLLMLQAFMATLALTVLPLAAVVRERADAEERSRRLAAIVESTDDAIIGKTLDGIVTSFNRGAERLYGYSASEMLGRSVLTIFPPECAYELPSILARLRIGMLVENYETTRLTREGRRVSVSVTFSPIRDERGQVIAISSIARDIGHRKEIEAARHERDILRSVASLAATTAHEINNPLSVVVGQADLLSEQVSAEERHRIDDVLAAAVRIQGIVQRMQHINKIVLLKGVEGIPAMLDLLNSSRSPPQDDSPNDVASDSRHA
jgi:PAS domain S-box-containing protein